TLFLITSLERGRIWKTPVRRDGFAWPYRAGFARCLIANRQDKVHFGCIRRGKLIPPFAAQARHVVANRLTSLHGKGIHLARWLAASAIGAKVPLAQYIEKRFGHDAARGITSAKHQHIESFFRHDQ